MHTQNISELNLPVICSGDIYCVYSNGSAEYRQSWDRFTLLEVEKI